MSPDPANSVSPTEGNLFYVSFVNVRELLRCESNVTDMGDLVIVIMDNFFSCDNNKFINTAIFMDTGDLVIVRMENYVSRDNYKFISITFFTNFF